MKKNKLTFSEIKIFLNKKGFSISQNKDFFNKSGLRSIFLTTACSFFVVLFFFSIPVIIEFKKKNIIISKAIENNSKSNFERTLEGKKVEDLSKIDEGLDLNFLFEDIFKFDELPNDTVRLNASVIQQVFKDTNYNLKDVRKTKLVKPIPLSHLPAEMKMIENTKKRKDLFIQIILPLVIEENNKIKLDRRKLFSILNKNNNSTAEKKWLNLKFKQYGVLNKDFSTLKVRMDYVPASLAIAQAAKETGWGTSRFAIEGNALFGQWTWTGEGIKPAGSNSDDTHKVMKFKILKASIRAYQRNLNTHSSYKNFRMERAKLRDRKKKLDSLLLANYLDRYAETGEEYVRVLKQIINQNKLTDFDDVKLLPSSIALESLI
ncbi:glucosaminidase domain-containing protein [Candidatus Pelagibacter sp.]|nr:glucosaminidase domain-containing protein [Candidatus Pelagibacter sp.]